MSSVTVCLLMADVGQEVEHMQLTVTLRPPHHPHPRLRPSHGRSKQFRFRKIIPLRLLFLVQKLYVLLHAETLSLPLPIAPRIKPTMCKIINYGCFVICAALHRPHVNPFTNIYVSMWFYGFCTVVLC